MKSLFFIATTILLSLSHTYATADDLADLLKESAEVRQTEMIPITKEISEAARPLMMKVQNQMQLINGQRNADKLPAEIRQQEMKRLRDRLAMLEQIEKFASSDEADQKEQLAAAESKLKELQQAQMELTRPGQKKLSELAQKYNGRHREFSEAMSSVLRESGEGDFASVERQSVSGQFHNCSCHASYYQDSARTLQVNLSYAPEQRFGRTQESWGDDILMVNAQEHYVLVRAGHFNVTINAANPKDWNKEKLKTVLKQLVDLETIAKLKAN